MPITASRISESDRLTTLLTSTPACPRQSDGYKIRPDYVPRPSAPGLDDPQTGLAYWTPERVSNAPRYQWHVYRWADRVARERGCRRILDAGCGIGVKLAGMLAGPQRELWGVDQPSAVEAAERIAPGPSYWGTDLDAPDLHRSGPPGRFDLIICADVLEHLGDPDVLLGFIRDRLAPGAPALLSTPDRDRLRGRNCTRSLKPDHVREWSREEFTAYVQSRGFRVMQSRVMPQDEQPLAGSVMAEALFRLRVRPRSPWACHAVLCEALPA